MPTCKSCSAELDLTMSACPSCGAEVPMGRLTGILGIVCRRCDAYNDPGAKTCIACGDSLSAGASPEKAPSTATPPPAPTAKALPPSALSPATVEGVAPEASAAGGTQLAAARTRPAIEARLVVVRGEASPGTTFRLGQDEVQAGRAQGQVLFPDDPCLADLHATFLVRERALLVRDEGAAGGVYVRLRGPTVPLRPGSLFTVGDRLLRFAGPLPPPRPAAGDGTRRLGSPRPEGAAVMVEEWLEGGVAGRAYLRTGPSITIGSASCSIDLGGDPSPSSAHAEIIIEADIAKLRDLGSPTGTFVRIPPGGELELHDGDALRIGREVLRVEVG